MRRTLLSALILLLITLLGLPGASAAKISRLRLERATTPGGEWEHVRAETMPVADGEFEDSFDATTAYYQMRIDVLDDDRPPAAIPLQDVPPRARNLAQQHLDENRDMGGDNSWQDVSFAPVAFPMYNPAVPGPAYIEFKLILAPEEPLPLRGDAPAQIITSVDRNRGFILVSMGPHDFPIVSYATQGPTRTEVLREMAGTAGVRIIKYDTVFMVAENAEGDPVAYLGNWPVRYPDSICDVMGKEWDHIVDEQGVQEPEGAPDLTGEAFESYQALKQHYLQSEYMQRARQRRREEATIAWDVHQGIDENNVFQVGVGQQITVLEGQTVERFIVGDPSLATIQILDQGLSITGRVAGGTVLHTLYDSPGDDTFFALIVTDEATLSPDKPTGYSSWSYCYAGSWSDQRKYEQRYLSSEGCSTGCGAVAWGMLYAWFDNQGIADLIGGPAPALEYYYYYAHDCITTVRGYVDSYCVGTEAATNPWEMPDGYKWADIDRGISTYSIATTYSVPCAPTSGCRDRAVQSICSGDKPAIIGLWCFSAHYCVAYAYAYRTFSFWGVDLFKEHSFKCNLGWGGSSPSWETGSVWYGNNPHFW